jgi:hypothetical protein
VDKTLLAEPFQQSFSEHLEVIDIILRYSCLLGEASEISDV